MRTIWLRTRLMLLVALMFAILFGLFSAIGYLTLGSSQLFIYFSLFLSFFLLFIQYAIGPKMVDWSMRVKYVSETEYPRLHSIVDELARSANIPKPKVGISQIAIPNAFAYGRTKKDARVCVTAELLNRLDEEELKAVLAHEISHVKHRDMLVITMLSVIPMICYHIFLSLLWSGGGSRENKGGAAAIGILAFLLYFVTNLLVLYASRIREYYADAGSVELTGKKHTLASALYKIVYGSAKYSKEQLKPVEGMRAFFASDPDTARRDLSDLRSADINLDGRIDEYEMEAFARDAKVSKTDRLLEIFSTHPALVKRIKALAS